MSDDELMSEAGKFRRNLLNFFWRSGVSPFEGEDLVQETYLRLWKYRREYKPTAKLSTFLFLLARQVRLDALRSDTRRERREKEWGSERTDVQEASPACERDEVRRAVARLPDPMREVVELGVFQELPYAEVAEILGIPVGTVKSRMYNAIRKLKELLDDKGS